MNCRVTNDIARHESQIEREQAEYDALPDATWQDAEHNLRVHHFEDLFDAIGFDGIDAHSRDNDLIGETMLYSIEEEDALELGNLILEYAKPHLIKQVAGSMRIDQDRKMERDYKNEQHDIEKALS